MGDTPFFPPPKPRSPTYREPAARDAVVATNEPSERRVVVTRPETSPASEPEPKAEPARGIDREAVRELVGAMNQEEGYWARQSFVVRHPRIVGGVLAALGAVGLGHSIEVLRHGGFYGVKSTIFSPVFLGVGLYLIVFGAAVDGAGRPKLGWYVGMLAAGLAGALIGGVVLSMLATS